MPPTMEIHISQPTVLHSKTHQFHSHRRIRCFRHMTRLHTVINLRSHYSSQICKTYQAASAHFNLRTTGFLPHDPGSSTPRKRSTLLRQPIGNRHVI